MNPAFGPPLIALLAGLGTSLAVTPIVRAIAIRFGYVNMPAADRWADKRIALLGGVGIVIATVLASALVLLLSGHSQEISARLSADSLAVGIFVAAGLMFGVGLLDDMVDLKPNVKFIAQVVGGAVLVMFGGLIPLTGWYPVNVLLSVFWFVAITNAVNLLDNMDGVAAGIAAIAAFFLGLSSLRQDSWLEASLAWGLTGACLGFLRYNFKPASIFMGDAGSLFIGAVLAGLAAVPNGPSSGSLVSVLFVPLVIVAVPILDTALVTVTRAIAGRAFYQGGRDHTTHRLVLLGLSEHQTAALLYAFALAGGLVSLWLTRLNGITGLAVGSVFLTVLALVAAYLGHLRVEYANEPKGSRRVTVLVTTLLYKRRLAEIVMDAVLCGVALIMSVLLRFDGSPPAEYVTALGGLLPVAITTQLVAFGVFGVYRGRWRYVGLPEVHRIGLALMVSLGILLLYVGSLVPAFASAPGVIYTNTLCTAALIISARFSFRSLRLFHNVIGTRGEPVILYGAGDAGELALREMLNNSSLALAPVCILDDDPHKHRARIHGIEVVGGIERAEWALSHFGARTIAISTKKLNGEVLGILRDLAARGEVRLIELALDFRSVDEGYSVDVRALRLVGGGSSAQALPAAPQA
jgi:UDP-GlcNAc:undecaprenyl-phosphate GlcNAc-1-phosphate transferase